MPYGSPDSLVESLHAKVLIIVISTEACRIPCAIKVFHLFLDLNGLGISKRKPTDNYATCQVVRKVDTFTQFSSDNTKKERRYLFLKHRLLVGSEDILSGVFGFFEKLTFRS